MSKLNLGCVKPQLFWLEERPVTKGQEGPTTHILAIQQLSFQKPHPLASGPKQHNLLRVLRQQVYWNLFLINIIETARI